MSFWLRRWTEQSRTPGAHTLPCWSAMTCTSMCRPPSTSRSMKMTGSPKVRCASTWVRSSASASSSSDADDADAAAAAAAAGLDDERVADRGRVPEAVVDGLDRAAAPRRDRDAGLLGEHLRLDLGAEQPHGLGRRADERHAERGAQLGEGGVLGDEAPADPGGVGAALPQRPAELGVVEVGDARAGVAEDDGLVGGAHERRAPLVLGVQGDDADAVAVLGVELAHGPDQPHGGLAPVHHSDAFEHPRDPLSVNPASGRR